MPRFTSKDGNVSIETSNAREIVALRRDGFKETVARTAEVREQDTESPAATVPAPKAPAPKVDKAKSGEK